MELLKRIVRSVIQKGVCLGLAAATLMAACPDLDAIAHFNNTCKTFRHFNVNQEKIHLEVQAMSLQLSSSRALLETPKRFPFLSRLWVRFKTEPAFRPRLTPEQQQKVQNAEARIRTLIPSPSVLYRRAAWALTFLLAARSLHLFETVPGMLFACGDVLLIGASAQWSLGRLLTLGSRVVRIIDIRGWQSGGWVTYFKDGSGIRARVKNPKRGSLAAHMEGMFRLTWWAESILAGLQGARLRNPDIWILHGHVRFATASRSQRKEAHPHQWVKSRRRTVWSVQDNRLKQSYRRVINTISHNGDFDDIQTAWRDLTTPEQERVENTPLVNIHGQTLSQRDAGEFLNRVFHTKNALKGDSPKIAGFVDLLYAQGQWDAAARMAWALGANDSTRDPVLTEIEIQSLAKILDSVFKPLAKTLLPPDAQILSQMTPDERARLRFEIIQRLENDPVWRGKFAGRIPAFTQLAVQAFLDYDLYTAVHEFMKRAIGSFGLVVTSSLAPDRGILTARKQPISIGFSKDQTLIGATSESAALKLQPFDYRIDLDMQGETAEVGIDRNGIFINVYPERPVSDLSRMQEPVVQIPQDVLERDRLIPLRDNPLVDALPASQGSDPVGADTADMPKVAHDIRAMWDRSQLHDRNDPSGFNLQTAEDFSRLFIAKALKKIVLRNIALKDQSVSLLEWLTPQTEAIAEKLQTGTEQPSVLPERMGSLTAETLRHIQKAPENPADFSEAGRPIDLLVVGFEDSLWVGQQAVDDLSRMFGKTRLVTMTSESSNKILKALKEQEKRPDAHYQIPGGVIDRNTIVLLISQSGQTFPTVNSALQLKDKLHLNGSSRIFSMSGELDTPLAQVLGQRYTAASSFSRRVFLNGSGRRPAEPSSVSAMAVYATLTELLIYLAEDMNRVFPAEYDPVGLKLSPEALREVKLRRDHWVDRDLPTIVGRDANGHKVDSAFHRHLQQKAWRWTFHVWDTWVGFAFSALYIWATVRFHWPTIGKLLGVEGTYLGHIDTLVYLSMIAVGTYLFRIVTRRSIFVRLGSRKVFLADTPAVYQPLEMYWTKLFSRSLKGLGIVVHGGNPRDHFTPRMAHRSTRGDVVWLGLPDKKMPALAADRGDSILSIKQFYGNVSMGNSVETLTIGRSGAMETLFDDHLALPERPERDAADSFLQSLTESRFDALSRMVAGYMFGHLWVRKVSLRGRLWNYARTQGGARVFSTASPVSGSAFVPPMVLPFISDGVGSDVTWLLPALALAIAAMALFRSTYIPRSGVRLPSSILTEPASQPAPHKSLIRSLYIQRPQVILPGAPTLEPRVEPSDEETAWTRKSWIRWMWIGIALLASLAVLWLAIDMSLTASLPSLPPPPALAIGHALAPVHLPANWFELLSQSAQTAADHVLRIKPGDTLGELVLRLRHDPALHDVLSGPLWGDQGAVTKLWGAIGEQSISGKVGRIFTNEVFDLSKVYAEAAPLASEAVTPALHHTMNVMTEPVKLGLHQAGVLGMGVVLLAGYLKKPATFSRKLLAAA